jgi:glycosyltransferase 2 family protein
VTTPALEAPPPSSPLKFILRLVFGVAVLAFVLSRIDFSTVTLVFGPRLFGGVALATLLLLVGQIVAALRWKVVWGDGSPSWSYMSRLYLIGGFFSLFLPTSVGGDAVRAAAATQASGRPGAVVASVLLDRFLGTIALFVYGLAGLLLAPAFANRLLASAQVQVSPRTLVLAMIAGVVLVAGGIWLARRSTKVAAMVADGTAAILQLARTPRRLLAALGLAFLVQAIYLVLWLILGLSVSLPIPTGTLLVTVPIVTAAAMLPITLSGIGVREAAWVLLLSGTGVPEGLIVSFSLLYLVANLIVGIIGGLLFMARGTAPPS